MVFFGCGERAHYRMRCEREAASPNSIRHTARRRSGKCSSQRLACGRVRTKTCHEQANACFDGRYALEKTPRPDIKYRSCSPPLHDIAIVQATSFVLPSGASSRRTRFLCLCRSSARDVRDCNKKNAFRNFDPTTDLHLGITLAVWASIPQRHADRLNVRSIFRCSSLATRSRLGRAGPCNRVCVELCEHIQPANPSPNRPAGFESIN
jgi:hypothetical protein